MKSLDLRGPALQRQVGDAAPLLLCLDYDGSLVPIMEHPSMAALPQRTRRLLQQLAARPGIQVVLISGRALGDLKQLVGLRRLGYAGNHGLEFHGPTGHYLHPVARATRRFLHQLATRLRTALREVPGAWVDDKHLSLSVHSRAVPASARRAFQAIVARLTTPYARQGLIRVTRGKRVVEIRPPARWEKGDLVAWLRRRTMRSLQPPRCFLVYAGDDQTDEYAFRVVNRYHGLSVFVGPRPRVTAARWRVNNPSQASALLAALLRARSLPRRSVGRALTGALAGQRHRAR